jgi:hypothetical protein
MLNVSGEMFEMPEMYLFARNGRKILGLLKEYHLLSNDFTPRRQFVYYSIGSELCLEK